jgi:hypothetical protein
MKRYTFFFCLLFLSLEVIPQATFPFLKPDSKKVYDTIGKIQKEKLDDIYIRLTGSSGEFINGRDYIPYYMLSQHKPMLRYGEKRSSSLVFNGRRFDNIVLMYDTYKDRVIYTDDTLIYNNRFCMVSLNKDNIDRFDLYFVDDTLTFRYFDKQHDTTFNLQDGFYEVVYNNKYSYLIRHFSSCSLSNGIFEYYYSPNGYVNINGRYVKITSKGKFIRLFGDKEDEVKQYIKTSRIRFHKASKYQIAGIIEFYENL